MNSFKTPEGLGDRYFLFPILKKKLRHREVESLAQGHTDARWPRRDKPSAVGSEPPLTHAQGCSPQDRFLGSAVKNQSRGFPGSTVVGNPPANAGDMGSSPGPGRSHMPRSN